MVRRREAKVEHTVALALLLSLTLSHGVRAKGNVEAAGDVLQFVLPATAAGLALGLEDNEGLFEFGKSAALTLGATYALKYTIDEERPDGGGYSFPSGHTSISFASAEFLRKRYGWSYGIPAYAAATFVGYSRVEADTIRTM